MQKGAVLISVLMIAALIATSAMLLHSLASLDTQIARNVRLNTRASFSAQAGLTHFTSMDYHYEDVKSAGKLTLVGNISDTDWYYVTAYPVTNFSFYVESVGQYRKGEKILSSSTIKATFKSIWVKSEDLN